MDPKWVIEGIIDIEQKEYLLMAYFQKMNKFLEEIKLYPMFIELSIHLGNIQTLLTQNRLMVSKKKFLSYDDELLFSDLDIVNVPDLSENDLNELKKVLQHVQPKLFDYFNIVKAIWTLVYDSITITIKRNKDNILSKHGFFYYKRDKIIYLWRYDIRKVSKTQNQAKTHVNLIYSGDGEDLTIIQLLSKFSKTYKVRQEKKYPIFEIKSTQDFPIEETLIPVSKRKIVGLINQSMKYEKQLNEKKLIENGVQ